MMYSFTTLRARLASLSTRERRSSVGSSDTTTDVPLHDSPPPHRSPSVQVQPVDIEDSLTRNLLDGAVSGAFYQISMARLAHFDRTQSPYDWDEQ